MTKALDLAFAALEASIQIVPDLNESKYPRRMSEFISTTLGADIWDKQVEIADAVDDHRYVAVASCHGAGKSHIAARIALAFLHTNPRSIVLTTAPTARQVQHVLWREINSAYRDSRYPLLGRCLTTRLEIASDWYAIGFKAKADGTKNQSESDAFQGFHADHVLVIFDEAAGVPESVFGSLDAAMTSENAKMLLIGNPTSVSGTFRDAFHRNRALWKTIKISAFDTPNFTAHRVIRPYLVTPQWVENQIKKRGINSPYVQSRIYANFPSIGTNKLIPLAWIESWQNRVVRPDRSRGIVSGVDIARYGDDESSLAIRCGNALVGTLSWQGESIPSSAKIVHQQLSKWQEKGFKIGEVRVDAIGLGAGVADILRENYDYDVVDISASVQASDTEEWPNFRHEMWWQLHQRMDIDEPAITIGEGVELDEDVIAQLCDIEYSHKDNRYNGVLIEPKDETKKRTGWSPDRAEAVVLAYCDPPGPGVASARPKAIVVSNEGGYSNAMKRTTSSVDETLTEAPRMYRGAKIARRRKL